LGRYYVQQKVAGKLILVKLAYSVIIRRFCRLTLFIFFVLTWPWHWQSNLTVSTWQILLMS